MILTGPAINAAVAAGEITIDPYDPTRLSPNAYDWRLGEGNLWKVERLLRQWPHRPISSSDRKIDALRHYYRMHMETKGWKPWKHYSGRDRWTALPAEFLRRG